jgi:hypothetical protein
MAFLRAYVAPFLIVLTFVVAMVAVSARIFLPSDMMAPAPIEEPLEKAVSPAALDTATAGSDLASIHFPGVLG